MMATATSPGVINGSTICVMVLPCPAPATSTSSRPRDAAVAFFLVPAGKPALKSPKRTVSAA